VYIYGVGHFGLLLLVTVGVPLFDTSGFVSSVGFGFGSGLGFPVFFRFSNYWLLFIRCWAVESSGSSTELLLDSKYNFSILIWCSEFTGSSSPEESSSEDLLYSEISGQGSSSGNDFLSKSLLPSEFFLFI
jgi:hypothetical protein